MQTLFNNAVTLLKKLIETPSFSKEENLTANIIAYFFTEKNIPIHCKENNVWAFNKYYDATKPTILLNSHHDTVKPNAGYTRNSFEATVENGRLYGLGSNDAGGALVSLIAVFLHFYEQKNLNYNLVLAATAEEEISGRNGIELIYPELGTIDFAIVGEPTLMQMAIAEKGLLVCDCTAYGKSGHAARNEGENAILKAIKDIQWLADYQFERVSPLLGPVKATTTIIHSGTQHNVMPDCCTFTVDIRINELYTHEEVLNILQKNLQSKVQPRSMRLKSSGIAENHPIVQAGKGLELTAYGSPTMSDQALIPCPSFKIGPGDSARSHTADEYIEVYEIEQGIDLYIKLLTQILL